MVNGLSALETQLLERFIADDWGEAVIAKNNRFINLTFNYDYFQSRAFVFVPAKMEQNGIFQDLLSSRHALEQSVF
jgi:hypothetical protein